MIEVRNLNKTYDRNRKNANHVLRDVSVSLPQTGFVCILGPSGCGKTSLLNAVGGLDKFDSGEISVGDVHLKRYGTQKFEAERNRSFGYIFQNYYLLQNHSVAYNVYLGLHSLKLTHREKLARVREALDAVDMGRYIRRRVSDLSGGQQQRVAIARALARRPRVIFADEPTGNLDEANTLNICTLLRQISKTSLVIMVTHEQRIAQFFADQIITLSEGQIVSCETVHERKDLSVDKDTVCYTGDYRQERQDGDAVQLRILVEDGAAPVNLVVVVEQSRIIIKTDDSRAIQCGNMQQSPQLQEGKRPVMSLEHLEQENALKLPAWKEEKQTRAGQGLTLGMMFSEARALMQGGGIRKAGACIFLALLTVLTMLTIGDYLTLQTVDPRDFVRTDSHIIEVQMERGENLKITSNTISDAVQAYLGHYLDGETDAVLVPNAVSVPQLSETLFYQMKEQALELDRASYVPKAYLKESSLIMGRMPENTQEIVVDRWVLDAILREDGVLQNSIGDISFFLDKSVMFVKKTYTATIVGISDDQEAAIYVDPSVLVTIGVNGNAVMTLSEFQNAYPGKYDDITLAEDECITIKKNGVSAGKPGKLATFSRTRQFTVKLEAEEDCYAAYILPDEILNTVMLEMVSTKYLLYCPDKAGVKAVFAQPLPEDLAGMLQLKVIDNYEDSWNAYRSASQMRVDARTIVTMTVLLLSAAMLYFLRRSQIQSRIELLVVYRLLGIPKGKLLLIFSLESCLGFLIGGGIAGILTYGVVTVLTGIEDVAFSMVLPWQAALTVLGGILAYYLLVTAVSLLRLLRLPPAKLAAKFDF